jgi:arabinan endo-1,5-alpha-L-arabinosidase
MTKKLTRRQFLNASLAVSAGIGAGLTGAKSVSAQETEEPISPTEEAAGTDEPATIAAPPHLELTGSIRLVHDPVIMREGDYYYLYCTGPGVPMRRSADLLEWDTLFPNKVLTRTPDWVREAIPNQNDFWAPDISFYNDKYHLYYSVSTFGSNRSVIGLATNVTLNPESDDYEWVDEGLVIESQRSDNYNCIDANVILDEEGQPWLSFGSFWTGIKMHKLDFETGKLSTEDETLYSIAQRHVAPYAIEAPFIIRKNDYYYLFVSFDFCCRGVDSTYHVRVGRSENVTGPYVDRDGVELLDGGGTQVTFPTEQWRGPGHNAILQEDDTEYIVYHSYDAEANGTPTLRITPLAWDADGWPVAEEG